MQSMGGSDDLKEVIPIQIEMNEEGGCERPDGLERDLQKPSSLKCPRSAQALPSGYHRCQGEPGDFPNRRSR